MNALIGLSTPSRPAGPGSGSATPAQFHPAPLTPAFPRLVRGPSTVALSPTFTPPVIPGVEDPSEWENHHRGVVEFYAPGGYVEHACAFRIADLLWRLNRLSRSAVDEVAQSIANSERDAATILAAESHPAGLVEAPLPVDPAALRRRQAEARRAAAVLSTLNQTEAHATVPDDRASAALRLLAEFCATLPGCQPAEIALSNPQAGRPPDGWTGARLRSALACFTVNRSLTDTATAALPYIQTVLDATTDRLARIETLTARLRRERLVPQTVVSSHIQESELNLSAMLYQTIGQLDALQSNRAGLSVTG